MQSFGYEGCVKYKNLQNCPPVSGAQTSQSAVTRVIVFASAATSLTTSFIALLVSSTKELNCVRLSLVSDTPAPASRSMICQSSLVQASVLSLKYCAYKTWTTIPSLAILELQVVSSN